MDAAVVNAAKHGNYGFTFRNRVLSAQCMFLVVVWGHVF